MFSTGLYESIDTLNIVKSYMDIKQKIGITDNLKLTCHMAYFVRFNKDNSTKRSRSPFTSYVLTNIVAEDIIAKIYTKILF